MKLLLSFLSLVLVVYSYTFDEMVHWVKQNDITALDSLYKSDSSQILTTDSSGANLLNYAIAYASLETITTLHKMGVPYLSDRGVLSVNGNHFGDITYHSPLVNAVIRNDREIVNYLLDTLHVDLNEPNTVSIAGKINTSGNALNQCWGDLNVEMFDFLISKGVTPDSSLYYFPHASRDDHEKKRLLNSRLYSITQRLPFNVYSRDSGVRDRSWLSYFFDSATVHDIVYLQIDTLLDHTSDARMQFQRRIFLEEAIRLNDMERVDAFIEAGFDTVSIRRRNPVSLIDVAVRSGNIDMTKKLLSKSIATDTAETLVFAAWNSSWNESKNSPETVNEYYRKRRAMISLLVDHGFNIDTRKHTRGVCRLDRKDGVTLMDRAVDISDLELILYLTEWGEKIPAEFFRFYAQNQIQSKSKNSTSEDTKRFRQIVGHFDTDSLKKSEQYELLKCWTVMDNAKEVRKLNKKGYPVSGTGSNRKVEYAWYYTTSAELFTLLFSDFELENENTGKKLLTLMLQNYDTPFFDSAFVKLQQWKSPSKQPLWWSIPRSQYSAGSAEAYIKLYTLLADSIPWREADSFCEHFIEKVDSVNWAPFIKYDMASKPLWATIMNYTLRNPGESHAIREQIIAISGDSINPDSLIAAVLMIPERIMLSLWGIAGSPKTYEPLIQREMGESLTQLILDFAMKAKSVLSESEMHKLQGRIVALFDDTQIPATMSESMVQNSSLAYRDVEGKLLLEHHLTGWGNSDFSHLLSDSIDYSHSPYDQFVTMCAEQFIEERIKEKRDAEKQQDIWDKMGRDMIKKHTTSSADDIKMLIELLLSHGASPDIFTNNSFRSLFNSNGYEIQNELYELLFSYGLVPTEELLYKLFDAGSRQEWDKNHQILLRAFDYGYELSDSIQNLLLEGIHSSSLLGEFIDKGCTFPFDYSLLNNDECAPLRIPAYWVIRNGIDSLPILNRFLDSVPDLDMGVQRTKYDKKESLLEVAVFYKNYTAIEELLRRGVTVSIESLEGLLLLGDMYLFEKALATTSFTLQNVAEREVIWVTGTSHWSDRVDTTWDTTYNWSLLPETVRKKDVEVVSYLLAQNVNYPDTILTKALTESVYPYSPDIILALVRAGAKPDSATYSRLPGGEWSHHIITLFQTHKEKLPSLPKVSRSPLRGEWEIMKSTRIEQIVDYYDTLSSDTVQLSPGDSALSSLFPAEFILDGKRAYGFDDELKHFSRSNDTLLILDTYADQPEEDFDITYSEKKQTIQLVKRVEGYDEEKGGYIHTYAVVYKKTPGTERE